MPGALERLREIRLTSPAPVLEWAEPPAEEPAKTDGAEAEGEPPAYTKYTKVTKPAFDPAASAVLGILVRAGQPVPHPAIVAALAEQGYDKAAARKAIASCQEKRWIEHDLLNGYVLTSKEMADEKQY